jgi:hydroxypyruvate isomerase
MIFTAYLDFWFTDRPLIERVAACAALGLRSVETWAWRTKPMTALAAECRRLGVEFNDTFDHLGGSLVDKADHARCLDAWAESLAMAQACGVKRLFMFSNQIGDDSWAVRLTHDYSPMEQYANLLDGAARVMELVEKTNVEVWFEALNTFHLHGVLVNTHALAADVVRRINHPQLRLSFDCYHQQRTAGNLIEGLEAYYGLYDTFHLGDVPTRAEPGTGEINFPNIIRKLVSLGYDGHIGLEFTPSRAPEAVLAGVTALFKEAGAHLEG